MRSLLTSLVVLAASSPASAQAIFPAGGEVPPTPSIWITATEMPAISIRSKGEPVMFEIDEMHTAGGVHHIRVTPQLDIGSDFTLTAGATTRHFTVVDGDRHGSAADTNEIEFHVERISIEHRGDGDSLMIDALAKHGTIMYLLDQANNTIDHTPPYRWIGEGRDHGGRGELPGGSPFPAAHRRFEIPLSVFGASCASQKTIDFSPYTQTMAGGATLYPIARIQIDRGKIRMPLELVDRFEPGDELDKRAWLPCATASVDAGPIETSKVSDNEKPEEAVMATGVHEDPQQFCIKTGEPFKSVGARINLEDDAPAPAEPADDTVACIQILVVLFGALLVMWRATAKIA